MAVRVRSGLTLGAGWALARLGPRVLTLAERRLFELTTSVDLAAYDDPRFCDELERARKGGAQSVQQHGEALRHWSAPTVNQIAADVEALHSMNHRISAFTAVDERGNRIPGSGYSPNRHDILTGSQPDLSVRATLYLNYQ